jgi:hypothetical protein
MPQTGTEGRLSRLAEALLARTASRLSSLSSRWLRAAEVI